jgi:hypothetical protein
MPDPRTPPYRSAPPVHARPHTGAPPDQHLARLELETRRRRGKPESNGVRMVIGLAGLASASALATAMLPSITPQPTAVTTVDTAAAAPAQPTEQPQPSVIHVTHVVKLQPGQTLPPDALVNMTPGPATPKPVATPRPTPRVIIQTITRQSGRP